jgi:4-hydroxy-2-oxoheptanedioate aldolase
MAYELKNNPMKEAVREKRPLFGVYIETPAVSTVEIAAIAGADFVRLDWSHAPLDLALLSAQVVAAERYGVTPMARLDYDPYKIAYCLDMGIMGIMVPGVNTPEQAKQIVDAARFSPVGDRGMFSINRKSAYGTVGGAQFKKWSNEEVMVGIQIESKEAIDNLEGILKVEGIDLILSGRGDIANSLGFPGQKNHPQVLETEKRLLEMAQAHGKTISLQLDPNAGTFSDDVKYWTSHGAYLIALGMDVAYLKKGFETAFTKARA